MALISLPEIRSKFTANYSRKQFSIAASLLEAQEEEYPLDYRFDVFLSHSYRDVELDKSNLLVVMQHLNGFGLKVYVDWIIDKQLNRLQVTSRTARTLRNRMDHQCLFFATSKNSQNSRWMPWELGYMDGHKGRVAILPLAQRSNIIEFKGQEYLGIYPYVDEAEATSGRRRLWINRNRTTYVPVKEWLKGANPTKH